MGLKGVQVLDQVYEQFLGSTEARYLSELIDEILYLKKQKGISKYKGTKYSFLFFFLVVIGGYFNIENIEADTKRHDGVFKYNGLITYLNEAGVDHIQDE